MLKAKDIMTKDVITLSPDTTVEKAGRLFIERGISGAPVLTPGEQSTALSRKMISSARNRRLHIPPCLRLFDAFIPLGATKLEEEIKRMAASTVGRDMLKGCGDRRRGGVHRGYRTIMTERNVHLLPVMGKGKLMGIIGKKNLIRGIAGETSQ